jgi:hypothetical protein
MFRLDGTLTSPPLLPGRYFKTNGKDESQALPGTKWELPVSIIVWTQVFCELAAGCGHLGSTGTHDLTRAASKRPAADTAVEPPFFQLKIDSGSVFFRWGV